MKKGYWTGTKKVLLTVIVVLGLIGAVLGLVLIVRALTEERIGAVLIIEEVYFVCEGDMEDPCSLVVWVFVTNDGEEDCEARIRAFAVEVETNLAMDDDEFDIGELKAQTTEEANLTLEVPSDGKYRVELLVFKDEKISVKGQGVVNLKTAQTGGQDFSTIEPDSAEKKSSLPFLEWYLLLLPLAIVPILYRRWRR